MQKSQPHIQSHLVSPTHNAKAENQKSLNLYIL